MGKVILLTGAPSTGKSTLRQRLTASLPEIRAFDYGSLLLELKARHGAEVSYPELRDRSASLVTPRDVNATDEDVIVTVNELRMRSHILLDSHAVTREAYGFRACPYSVDQLTRLKLDGVIVLRCDPDVLIERLEADSQGRRRVSIELAREHQLLQAALGLQYAVVCGCPYFVLDTTVLSKDDVRDQALKLLSPLFGTQA